MKAKETRVARGTSPYIMKAGASSIPSPIMKARASPFITEAGTSPIPNIERRALQRNISVSYAPYKAHSQLGSNSGDTRSACSCRVLTISFPFWRCHFAVMN
jgi:hypothetical protein